jgi:hypothetical protein
LGIVLVAACTSTKDCTTAGCVDGIAITAPDFLDPSPGTLTICVEDVCEDTAFGPDEDVVDLVRELDRGDSVSAVLDMPDGKRYIASMRVGKVQPNGDGCGPVCDRADLQLVETTVTPQEREVITDSVDG